jgi:hypothetical protein
VSHVQNRKNCNNLKRSKVQIYVNGGEHRVWVGIMIVAWPTWGSLMTGLSSNYAN